MSTIMKNRKPLALLLGLFLAVIATSALVSHLSGTADASGIPKVEPLVYSGLLADKTGKPLSGSSHSVKVSLWTAQSSGTQLCTSSSTTVDLSKTAGRFRVSLPDTCVDVVHRGTVVWTEVKADGVVLPRTRIGAVPYAVEAQRVAEMDCPPGYEREIKTTTYVLCQRTNDEMVKVGDYWIDRHEMSVVDSAVFNGNKCNGTGKQYGAGTTDDYPASFPDSGDATTSLYACSVTGKTPSRNMTWFQAQQACLSAGKHLCTNAEWQGAAAGTHDPGAWPDTNEKDGCTSTATAGSCNTCSSGARAAGSAGSVPGDTKSCLSRWGAADMVGNLYEWTAFWGQTGKPGWLTVDGANAFPWPATYGDGLDSFWNWAGRARNPQWMDGAPGAALRGGAYHRGTRSGTFTLSVEFGPARNDTFIGGRCCRR